MPATRPALTHRSGGSLPLLGWLLAAVSWGGVCADGAWAQTASVQGIYTCVDGRGRKITSDRPIPECLDREQRLLNRDGSQRATVGPSMTAEERAAYEDAQRKKLAEDAARKDVIRHDRNLLGRYPNAAAHARARESAIEPAELAVRGAEKRLVQLAKEREQLDAEAEFYKGKERPRKLQAQYGQNQAASEAQHHAIEQHRAEVQRINALFDEELLRLKKLWAGAQPGTVGPIPTAVKPAAAPLSPASPSSAR